MKMTVRFRNDADTKFTSSTYHGNNAADIAKAILHENPDCTQHNIAGLHDDRPQTDKLGFELHRAILSLLPLAKRHQFAVGEARRIIGDKRQKEILRAKPK